VTAVAVRRSSIGTEWEQVHPGYYIWGTREIMRVGPSTWELSGMVIDTSRYRSLRKAMDAADNM
jgi:hypothetical protein